MIAAGGPIPPQLCINAKKKQNVQQQSQMLHGTLQCLVRSMMIALVPTSMTATFTRSYVGPNTVHTYSSPESDWASANAVPVPTNTCVARIESG